MKQNANIYTMMLILSFLATLVGCLFLYFEMSAYDMQKTVPADLKAPTALPALPSVEEPAAVPDEGEPADAPDAG